MGLSAFALFATTLVLAMHHQSPDRQVPRWIRFSILKGLGTLLCVQTPCGRSTHQRGKPDKVFEETFPTQIKCIAIEECDEKERVSLLSLLSEVVKFTRMIQAKNTEKDEQEQNKKDWTKVAGIIDRFFLIIYCVITTVTTIILFINLA